MNSSGIPTETDKQQPLLGIIGGSGMCTFPNLHELTRVRPMTKYGLPSCDISLCEYNGRMVAFIPRHGKNHSIAPHKVPYKANLAALKQVGVQMVLATCIVGSLKEEISPGTFVIPDQFVNLTWGRDDYVDMDGGEFVHLPMADPYCSQARGLINTSLDECGCSVRKYGTVAVIQGPRFSTRAESQMYIRNGWDIVNMTQYPECYFARELGLCYGAIASVTDYDVGVESTMAMQADHMDKVLEVFRVNIERTRRTLLHFLETQKINTNCNCSGLVGRPYYEQ